MDSSIEVDLESLSATSPSEIVNEKIKFNIVAKSRNDKNFIYDYLTNPLSGCSCLSGVKTCIGKHNYLEKEIDFEFTCEEYKKVLELDQVEYISILGEESIDYTKKIPKPGVPRIANFPNAVTKPGSTSRNIAHHLYYGQNFNPTNHSAEVFSGSDNISLSSIDCSNVDIVILDTGVDPTHSDFLDENLNSRVVEFDWRQLKDPADVINGTPIVTTQPTNYYQDTQGHGTSCASLAAGNSMGYAKNAKIYSLRSNSLGGTNQGFDTSECLELMISFQKSKKQNLYGLDSTRPTVMSNSWGYNLNLRFPLYILTDNQFCSIKFDVDNATKFFKTVGTGHTSKINRITAQNTSTDSYFREILNEGVHVLTSAGNNNHVKHNPGIPIKLLVSDNDSFKLILQDETAYNAYTGGTFNPSMAGGHALQAVNVSFNYGYGSPNIGNGYSKNDYPIIMVGCVTPIGDDKSADDEFFASASQPKSTFNILSSTDSSSVSNKIIFDSRVRYNNLDDDFFCKSNYSCFGPDVDIYAPGAGNWAALSNNISLFTYIPSFKDGSVEDAGDGYYRYFDGTSSSCPIAAGILATYLADYPNSTNIEAKNWLLTNSISGNILEAKSDHITLSSYNAATQQTTLFDVPFVADFDSLEYHHLDKIKINTSRPELYNTGTLNDLLFNCSIHGDSHNRVAQAYPLRNAILQTNGEDSITFSNTTLNLSSSTQTQQSITHPNYN